MGDAVLRQFRIPVHQNADHMRKTIVYRNLTRAQHRDEVPAHLTGCLRRKGGDQIIRHRKDSASDVVRLHPFILRQNLLQQLARGLQNKLWFIGCYGCCSTDSTDRHRSLLEAHLEPLSLLRGGGEGEGEEKEIKERDRVVSLFLCRGMFLST